MRIQNVIPMVLETWIVNGMKQITLSYEANRTYYYFWTHTMVFFMEVVVRRVKHDVADCDNHVEGEQSSSEK